MEKKKMKENIIIRLERENEYHEVENLVRESFVFVTALLISVESRVLIMIFH